MTSKRTQTAEGTVPNNLGTLLKNVQEDPTLTPHEKETVIRWGKPDDRAYVFTEEGSLVRRLLRHPQFEVKALRTSPENEPSQKVQAADHSGGRITGVRGWIPIQAVKVQSACRQQSAHCHVVSADGLVDP